MCSYDKLFKKKNDKQYDLLIGNINRMFLTDDYEELTKMYEFALVRLRTIESLNAYRIENQVKK